MSNPARTAAELESVSPVANSAHKADVVELNRSNAKQGKTANKPIAVDPSAINQNEIRETIREFRTLIDEMDEIRENLRAHGVPLRTTRMIVEFGIQNKPERQASAMDGAMEQVEKQFGTSGLSRKELESYIATVVDLERDLSHARGVARSLGLDAQALGILTQMIQNNPGDGGAKAVNTFVSYAVACDIKLDRIAEILPNLVEKPKSVLPVVEKIEQVSSTRERVKNMATDAIVGLGIGIVMILLLI